MCISIHQGIIFVNAIGFIGFVGFVELLELLGLLGLLEVLEFVEFTLCCVLRVAGHEKHSRQQAVSSYE